MNLLDIMRELRDCVCQLGEVVGSNPPANNYPVPPGNTMPELDESQSPEPYPAIPGGDGDTAAGNRCQSARGLASHLRHVLRSLATLVSIGDISSQKTAQVLRETGVGGDTSTFVVGVTTVLIFIAAKLYPLLMTLIGVAGWDVSNQMNLAADAIEDDIFVCAFFAAPLDGPANVQEVTDLCHEAIDDLPTSADIKLLAKFIIWPEKVSRFLAHQKDDGEGGLEPFTELSTQNPDCWCSAG